MGLILNETGKIIHVTVNEKLTKEDYQQFVPRLEKDIKENGKIRILFQMQNFHGWEMSALWEDLKFDMKHFSDIERLAMVGDKKWEKAMSVFCKPFTTAKINFFESSDIEKAQTWLQES